MEDYSDPTKYKVMSNGGIYDLQAKRIVKGPTLTNADASALRARREEKRQAIARLAANQAVQRGDFHTTYGDQAYFAAIIDTAMLKATTPEDPKAIESGRFVLTMTGDLEVGGPGGNPVDEARGLLRDLADLARAIQAEREAVDGHATDINGQLEDGPYIDQEAD